MDKPPRPSRTDVFLNYKIWLSDITGNGQIEHDTYELLQNIDAKGSLKAASDASKMSYRKAWGKIKLAEDILQYPLIDKHRGGKDGGNSTLTPAAHRLLEAYKALQEQFDDNVEQAFKTFNDKINKTK